MCRIQKFCFCATVRTGAIVGAVANALLFVSLLIQTIKNFIDAHNLDKNRDYNQAKAYRIAGAINAVQSVLALIILILLSLGIHKNRSGFVMPWLIAAIILIVVGVINTIVALINTHEWALIISLVGYAFWCYVWVAVLSFYRDLRDGVRGPHV